MIEITDTSPVVKRSHRIQIDIELDDYDLAQFRDLLGKTYGRTFGDLFDRVSPYVKCKNIPAVLVVESKKIRERT